MSRLPRKVLVEGGAIEKIGEVVEGKKPLVVADSITKEIAGERIRELLKGKIIVVKDSTMEEVEKVEKEEADCIISVGGGKVIDVGKLAAHRKAIPFISVPTACAHDGIVSENVSLTVDGKYSSIQATTPFGVVADLDILSKSPYRTTASGAADIISKYTSIFDWRLGAKKGEEYSEPIANLSLMCADLVSSSVEEIKNKTEKGMKNLVWSLIFSGMAMTLHGSSRPASGAEHMFSHALDRLGPFGLHGEQVGIGTIFFSYLQGSFLESQKPENNQSFSGQQLKQLANWQKIKNLLSDLGAPTKAADLKIPQDVLVKAFLEAKNTRKRYTILDEKPLDEKLVLEICRKTGII